MGNCQAIDSATLVIQHPCGKTEKFYWPVSASEVMKSNPGHYVALLLTTTTFCPATVATTSANTTINKPAVDQNKNNTLRVTRIKLLRPTDTLIMGQVYRLVSNQEVMKGLSAKKHAKMKKNQNEQSEKKETMKQKPDKDSTSAPSNSELEKNKQVNKQEKRRSRTTKGATAKSRPWQPSLISISESTS